MKEFVKVANWGNFGRLHDGAVLVDLADIADGIVSVGGDLLMHLLQHSVHGFHLDQHHSQRSHRFLMLLGFYLLGIGAASNFAITDLLQLFVINAFKVFMLLVEVEVCVG